MPPDLTTLPIGALLGYGLFILFGGGAVGVLGKALFDWLTARRNAESTDKKIATDAALTGARNADEAENELVERYRSLANSEREAKDSAVSTIRALLVLAQEQITTLKGIITDLTETIKVMTESQRATATDLANLTAQRDALQGKLTASELELTNLKQELIRTQAARFDGAELVVEYPQRDIDAARSDTGPTITATKG